MEARIAGLVLFPENATFGEEVEDMLERTSSNPNAIIHSTLHNYPVM